MADLDGREVKAISSPAHLSTCRGRNRRSQEHEVSINASNGLLWVTCGRGISSR